MVSENTEPGKPHEPQYDTTEENTADEVPNEDEEPGRLRGALSSARQGFTRSFDRLSGAEYQRQFEEFTNVVTTAILGVHRDQSELAENLTQVEHSSHVHAEPQDTDTKALIQWVIAFGVISMLALILSVVALVRTF